jgi:MoaA/NifB/PqqE/SkfB family radical SAM enzyme
MDARSWKYKPNIVQIEAVQGCNRHCTFCGTAGIERQIHFAKEATIRPTFELIRKANLNCRILLAGHGEPTLHPDIVRMVHIVRRILPDNMIHLFTNGTTIEKNPSLVASLFEAGLNDLVFDEYSDHRVGEFVRRNETCRRYQISEQGPGSPLFAGKNPKAKRICIVPPIDAGENTASRKLNTHCGAGMRPQGKPMTARCTIIFRDFFVRWDGNVAICCNDFRGEYYVTNIEECHSFEEAYFHPRLESARRYLFAKDRGAIHPCDVCNAIAIRPGLLPDANGKRTMREPNAADARIIAERREPLAKIVRREWE